MAINLQNKLWAITSYFNPLHYERRVSNYHHFRRHLTVPLVTVELGFGGKSQLTSGDAEILIQLQGGSALWQKENLLNIALSHLPSYVSCVAWLDCDIRLLDSDWDTKALMALGEHKLVQLFSELYDLTANHDPLYVPTHDVPSGFSITNLMSNGKIGRQEFRPSNSLEVRRAAFGLAWAASRDLMNQHKFYEAAVLGSGDRAMFCAAVGRFEDAVDTLHMNKAREIHYLRWAKPFFEQIGGQVTFLSGSLVHSWHGELENRHYASRHRNFNSFAFDPALDLRRDEQGIISWDPSRGDLETFALDYFRSRHEDGPAVDTEHGAAPGQL
jgi:hypothetical protein